MPRDKATDGLAQGPLHSQFLRARSLRAVILTSDPGGPFFVTERRGPNLSRSSRSARKSTAIKIMAPGLRIDLRAARAPNHLLGCLGASFALTAGIFLVSTAPFFALLWPHASGRGWGFFWRFRCNDCPGGQRSFLEIQVLDWAERIRALPRFGRRRRV